MLRQLTATVTGLPRVGTVRLYDDDPCILPGERTADAVAPGWIVEPVPGYAAWGLRISWHLLGRWVWAWRQPVALRAPLRQRLRLVG